MKQQFSSRRSALVALLIAAAALSGCDRIFPQRDLTLPDLETVRRTYASHGLTAEFRYSGNVLEMVIEQPVDQIRRGGPLWARVGPYIYVFSPGTRELFDEYVGLAGVRAITVAEGTEVARALLVRDALNEISWPRSRAILAEALDQGTERPSTMDRLAKFGEQYTDYSYNRQYVPQQ
jgi:hypothetical protein